jgi:hypothetical protein
VWVCACWVQTHKHVYSQLVSVSGEVLLETDRVSLVPKRRLRAAKVGANAACCCRHAGLLPAKDSGQQQDPVCCDVLMCCDVH